MTLANPESAFNELATALKGLGASLEAAVSVRYEPSPGLVRASDGPSNPTLDTVLDPRRSEVSTQVTRATVKLWHMTREVSELAVSLDNAVLRWEGETPVTDPS